MIWPKLRKIQKIFEYFEFGAEILVVGSWNNNSSILLWWSEICDMPYDFWEVPKEKTCRFLPWHHLWMTPKYFQFFFDRLLLCEFFSCFIVKKNVKIWLNVGWWYSLASKCPLNFLPPIILLVQENMYTK
jgi:hypothetical protein